MVFKYVGPVLRSKGSLQVSIVVLVSLLLSGFLSANISQASVALTPKELDCPTFVGSAPPVSSSTVNVKAMMFNGQYFQRVNPASGEILDRPQGIVGCYKYFSKNMYYI